MAFCDQCGTRLPAGANFCPECGARQVRHEPTHFGTGTPTRSSSPAAPAHDTYSGGRGLKTNRGLLKTILLSFLTFGIYGLIVHASIVKDLNRIASPYDGRKTMNFWLMIFIVTPLTFGIGTLIWANNMSDRIGNELFRRRIPYSFGSSTFWIWSVLLSLLFGIGPLVYLHKLYKAMNYLAQNYNESNGLA